MSQEINGYFQRATLPAVIVNSSGVIGSPTATVDIVSTMHITAGGPGLELHLPAPTDVRPGRVFTVYNEATAALAFKLNGFALKPGNYTELHWDGTTWLAQAAAASASGLPVPKVMLAQPQRAGAVRNPNGVDFTVARDGTKLYTVSMPFFTGMELTESLFAADLRLELLRYTTRQMSNQRYAGKSGYVHPTHFVPEGPGWLSHSGGTPVANVLPNDKFRGGAAVGQPRTVTEWSITSNTQTFLIDTLGDFYTANILQYVDTLGNNTGLDMFVPSQVSANGSNAPGKTFGYSRRHRPNYFKFRFSIADPDNSRSRITGPETGVFVMAPQVHPFRQDAVASQTLGRTAVTVAPGFAKDKFDTWMETRLPSRS